MQNPLGEISRPKKRKKWDVAAPEEAEVKKPAQFLKANPQFSFRPASQPTSQGLKFQPSVNPQNPNASSTTHTENSPPSAEIVQKAKQDVMGVLQKINQELKAKGALPPRIANLVEDAISREVTINDAPPAIRFNLTRRAVQDDIAKRTGTQISVRGQFYPGGSVRSGEPPLHLKILPGMAKLQPEEFQHQAVDMAAREIQYILNGGEPGTFSVSQPPSSAYASQSMSQGFPQHPNSTGNLAVPLPRPQIGLPQNPQSYNSVPPPNQAPKPADVPLYVGLEAPEDYDLEGRLRGSEGIYLQHISTQTGAQVSLRGGKHDSQQNSVLLHILISAETQEASNEAIRLAQKLIDTARADHKRAFPQGYQPIKVDAQAGPWQSNQGQNSEDWSSSYPVSQPIYTPPVNMTQQHIHQPFYSHQNLQPPYATQNQPPHQNQPSYGHTIGTQNFENRGSNPQYGNQPGNQFYPIGQNQAAPMYPTLPSGIQQIPGTVRPMTSNSFVNFQSMPSYQGGSGYGPPSQSYNTQGFNYGQNMQETERPNEADRMQQNKPQEEPQKRKRFKEFKEKAPLVPEKPAPYTPKPMGNLASDPSGPQSSEQTESSLPTQPPLPSQRPSQTRPNEGSIRSPGGPKTMGPPKSMGPPPPRFGSSSMGPPPPRPPNAMGPPAPKPPNLQGSGQDSQPVVSGSLAGLLDYDE